MGKQNETMEEALESAATLKQDIECGILVKFDELRFQFLGIDSPDKARLKENKIKELEDLLHGDNAGTTLTERGSFKFYARNYVKEYILNGEMKVVEKSEVGGFYLAHEYEWIIDTHAHYKFHQWLTSAEGDEIEGLFDYTPYLRFQLMALKNSCKRFIESGDRAIYRSGSIPQILKAAHTMGTNFPDRFALRFHGMIKEAFEDSYVHEALNIKGICPGIKGQIETTLKELPVLIARMEARKQKPPKVYSFDDWLNNVFVTENTWAYDPPLVNNVDGSLNWGRQVLNDSEIYECLVPDRMSSETLEQIRKCQTEAYHKIVMNEFNHCVSSFEKKVAEIREGFGSESAVNDFVSDELAYIEKFKALFPEHHQAILIMKKFRNIMPYGAKFITAEQYKKPESVMPSVARFTPSRANRTNAVMAMRNGKMTRVETPGEKNEDIRYPDMCEGEMEYAFIHGLMKFKYWLENWQNSMSEAKEVFNRIKSGGPIHPQQPAQQPAVSAGQDEDLAEGEMSYLNIALLTFYGGRPIRTEQGAAIIAKKYGKDADSAGRLLWQDYKDVAESPEKRLGSNETTLKKRKRRIKENILELLTTDEAKNKCLEDLQWIETRLKEY